MSVRGVRHIADRVYRHASEGRGVSEAVQLGLMLLVAELAPTTGPDLIGRIIERAADGAILHLREQQRELDDPT
jgi:hypothetical protein